MTPFLPSTVVRAADRFVREFGTDAQFAAVAPGRLNLMGDHVDYCGGWVLPMALNRCTAVVGTLSNRPDIEIFSTQLQESVSLARGADDFGAPVSGWMSYVQGVVAGFVRRNFRVPGFFAVIDSDVPVGSGLSSSAALEVAVATFLEALLGVSIDPWEKARICQEAEHQFAGVPCGIMDQVASVFGQEDRLILLDCDSLELRRIPISTQEVSILSLDTGVHHELGASAYPERRAACERAARLLEIKNLRGATEDTLESRRTDLDPLVFRRARHVVREIDRTHLLVEALGRWDWDRCGTLFWESHESLRDDFEVSCFELDAVVETARALGPSVGILGCRMTGGGFGGNCVALVKTARLNGAISALTDGYQMRTGLGLSIAVNRPGAGAHQVILR